jgi:hypothetical protein
MGNDEKKWICHCGKAYKMESGLKIHQKTAHRPDEQKLVNFLLIFKDFFNIFFLGQNSSVKFAIKAFFTIKRSRITSSCINEDLRKVKNVKNI